MFSGPTSIFSKDSGQPSRKNVTQDSLQSVTLRTSRIISPKGRMPKIFVLNTMIHRRRERKQVDTTLQLKIQSCSNDITWNTIDGDRSWSFLQSWVPRTMITVLLGILVQRHLYSDFLGGHGVDMSAIFLLATRRNMSKTHTSSNRKESLRLHGRFATWLWLADSVLRYQVSKSIKWPNAFKPKVFSRIVYFKLNIQVKNLSRTFTL